uniref:Uncharacterized protein n=1 Tax=Pavo cristatus TaxID=9049 RepID=A0A8C9FN10_PAVCR
MRDPRAHRFLGQIYEVQDNTEKAVGCYKRSVELNPVQKDLVLKTAELLCNKDTSDGRAKYWVEKAARLFPGNPAALRLKEKLLEYKVEDGWNELFYVTQAELRARPDDVYLNMRLVALYHSRNKLRDAVLHIQDAEKKIPLETSLEWCSCVMKTLEVPKSKSKLIKGDPAGQDKLEKLACDQKNQSGHMVLNLSHGKDDFLKETVESFANTMGLLTLFESLSGRGASRESSFLGTDEMGNVSTRAPMQEELTKYDIGAVQMHNGSLQHLVWLGLKWNSVSVLPPMRQLLKQLFHLSQETSRLETDAPETICLLDLEVFLLGMVFTSNLELQEKFNTHNETHQPPFLPLLLCKQYYTEKQRSWWDAVRTLILRKTSLLVTKLKFLVQHGLSTLRALEKRGLQPALIIHWARSLQNTGASMKFFCDQKEYIGRSVYYWKKILISLETIKKSKNIPEPTDPLFKHFHNVDIQVAAYEEEARIAFAVRDAVEGKTDDAFLAFEAMKNVVSYWNLAELCQRKAEEIMNDDMLPEEQEHKTYLLKRKHYLTKIVDKCSSDLSVADKLPVSIETVTKMLNTVMQELGELEEKEEEDLSSGKISQAADSGVNHSIPLPKKLLFSPTDSYKFSPKTLPQWAEDAQSLLQMLCQQVDALKDEIQEMKCNNASVSVSSHQWPAKSCGTDAICQMVLREHKIFMKLP